MKPIHARVRDAEKAGYALEAIQPIPVARACAQLAGRTIKPILRFVRP